MIGHVPRQPSHQRVGQGGAGVFQHVGDIGAAAMFGQQVKPQERLADKHRDQPDKQQRGRSEREACQQQREIGRQHDPRLVAHNISLPRRHEVILAAPRRIAHKGAHMADPHRNAGNMQEVLAPGFRLRRGQFGVLARHLREPVMGEMEIAEPARRQQDQKSAGMGGGHIEPTRPERGLVTGLMQQREQEHQNYALRQHQRRPERHPRGDQPAQNHNSAEMQRQLGEPAPVRCLGQLAALLGSQACEKLFVIHAASQCWKHAV